HALTPSYHLIGGSSGNNFAIAGAKAVDEDGNEATPDINLPTQVNAFLAINGGVAPSDALYIMLIGGNDIRAAREIRSAAVFADTPQERQAIRRAANASLNTAVASEQAQLLKLIAAGAQNILVSNAPDIGAIPETDLIAAELLANAQTKRQTRKAKRFAKVATKLSTKFNRKLARKLARTEHQTGVDIIEYDLFSFLTDQIDNAEDYGYTNTDDACAYMITGGGALHPDCDGYVTATGFIFYDEIHPTTQAHQAAGAEIVDVLLAQ
ncbi:MAG: outer membrane lipase/esterase, partial [Oleiphilaceae bacterium]